METKTVLLPWLHGCPSTWYVQCTDSHDREKYIISTVDDEFILYWKNCKMLPKYSRFKDDPDFRGKLSRFLNDVRENHILIPQTELMPINLCIYARDVRTFLAYPYRLDDCLSGVTILSLDSMGLLLEVPVHSMMDYLIQDDNQARQDEWFKEIAHRLSPLDILFGNHIMFSEYIERESHQFIPKSITITNHQMLGMGFPFRDMYLYDVITNKKPEDENDE